MPDIQKIHPLGKRVLVQPDDIEAVTAGGLVLPPSANDDKKPATGIIISLGKGKEDGKEITFDVKEGDRVYFKKYAPEEVEIDGKKLLLLDTEDILATIK
jgi:chaperonin GroES